MTPAGSAGMIVTICLLLGLFGPLDQTTVTLAVLPALALWAVAEAARGAAAIAVASRPERARAALRAAAPVVLLAPVLPLAGTTTARVACVGLAACLGSTPSRAAAARFAGLVLAFILIVDHVPSLWSLHVEVSRVVTRAAGAISGQRIDWGPSASGMGLLVVFLLALATGALPAARPRFRAALCLLAWFLFVAAAPSLAAWRPAWVSGAGGLLNQAGEHLDAGAAAAAPAIFRLSWLWCGVLLLIGRACSPRAEAPPVSTPGFRWSRAAALGVMVAAAFLLDERAAGPPSRGPIVLLKSPLFDLEVPRPERPGIASSGMMGLLGRYAALAGHTLTLAERPVRPGILEGARALLVVLPASDFTREEKRAIDRFVRSGGSLLVAGDHTDLLGTMGPLNDLTGRYGIRFRFDSAYPVRREWRGCVRSMMPGRLVQTGIGTGASLALRAPARPLVAGPYALSDGGDRGNGGQGAWLGDYAYQPGERLGDLALLAERRAGHGRVVVMGDTSPLQNVALPWSFAFVSQLFDHLCGRTSWWERWGRAAPGMAALLLALLYLRRNRGVEWTAGAACGVLAASLISAALPPEAGRLPLPPGLPVALVDDGHLNDWTRELWHDASIGGLMANLQRGGWLPVVTDRVAGRLPGPEALAVYVAPRRRLEEPEVVRLAAHIEQGGRVLVASGGPEGEAVAPLLSLYGMRLGRMPLGPVPVRPDMTRHELEQARLAPQFRSAWPVETAGAVRTRSLLEDSGHDVVVSAAARSGSGGSLIVIGDAEFLTDRVLENENAAWKGNVDLLSRILSPDRP